MHKAQCRNAIGITQIIVERADLIGEQQALVDDGARRKAGHIQLGNTRQAVLFSHHRQRVLRLLADGEQLAFERGLICRACAALDEALADHRHGIDHGFAQAIHRDRDIAPADQFLTFLGDEFFEEFGDEQACGLFLRQEAHGHGIIAGLRQFLAF